MPGALLAQTTEPTSVPVFEKDILPIFVVHCRKCHNPDKAEAGLDLMTAAKTLAGGHAGPILVSGSADKSVLYKKVLDKKMPPPAEKNPLGDLQIALIKKWIDEGAVAKSDERVVVVTKAPEVKPEDRDFWAFRRPVATPAPKPKTAELVRTPVDAYLLSRLETQGLSFSPDADRLTLLRRAHLDLVGLPPTPAETKDYVSDIRPDAYERTLENLLDRPEYGERWGRHWLDTAGYTDAPHCDATGALLPVDDWRYRDYVVDAFNRDKPYDRFVTEQLAGDELVPWRTAEKYTPEFVDALTATGYLRTPADWTHGEGVMVVSKYRFDVLSRVVDHVSTGLLGMTMGCVRCHSHKFDPIPHQDYYRMTAVFATAYNLEDWKRPIDRFLPDVSKQDQETIDDHNKKVDTQVAECEKRIEELQRPHRERLFAEKLATVTDFLRDDVKAAFDTPADQRNEVQKYLFKKFEKVLKVSREEAQGAITAEDKVKGEALQQEIAALKRSKRYYSKLQALYDTGTPPTVRLLLRGDADTPGPGVEPGFITVLCEPGQSTAVPPPDKPADSSGRRLALARWITSRDNPLAARVLVNRVWQYHFGKGIVATTENFGHSGVPPTHPELLDWLAVDFMEHGWSIKRLHRLLMTSTAYRQSAYEPASGRSVDIDPENKLLWRMNIRRLEAELIRDSVLAVSDKLDRAMGGPPIPMDARSDGLVLVNTKGQTSTSQYRRSMYLMSQRGSHASGKGFMLSMLEVFDFPEMVINCTRRSSSTTPLQSLALINSDFMAQQARYFAERVRREAGPDATPATQVEAAFMLALGRRPNAAEIQFCVEHLRIQTELFAQDRSAAEGKPGEAKQVSEKADSDGPAQQALASLCLMLMASNEFIFNL